MRIRYTTWSMAAMLLFGLAVGYAAPPGGGAGDSTSAPAATAKSAPAHPSSKTHRVTSASTRRRAVHPSHSVLAHAQTAPAPARITEIQSALSREGAYQGEPNGRWDAASIDAMRQFQTKHDLNPSGKIDALTLQKLGLGSQVAGMGAPMPVAGPEASAADNAEQTERP